MLSSIYCDIDMSNVQGERRVPALVYNTNDLGACKILRCLLNQ
jgi:hypothetical protein